jgi:hypothetical protein
MRIRVRFGLRTLFVVVGVVALWLGYQWNWIRQWHAAMVWMKGQFEYWSDVPVSQQYSLRPGMAPWPLCMFGEQGMEDACVLVAIDEEPGKKQAELQRLFPEASNIAVLSPGPGYAGKHAGELKRSAKDAQE